MRMRFLTYIMILSCLVLALSAFNVNWAQDQNKSVDMNRLRIKETNSTDLNRQNEMNRTDVNNPDMNQPANKTVQKDFTLQKEQNKETGTTVNEPTSSASKTGVNRIRMAKE